MYVYPRQSPRPASASRLSNTYLGNHIAPAGLCRRRTSVFPATQYGEVSPSRGVSCTARSPCISLVALLTALRTGLCPGFGNSAAPRSVRSHAQPQPTTARVAQRPPRQIAAVRTRLGVDTLLPRCPGFLPAAVYRLLRPMGPFLLWRIA